MERELLLLGLLRRHEMHGYQLADFIENNLASCTDLKKATAYNLLEKMSQRGWLISSESSDSNRPTKTVYQVTEAGEAAFQELLRENLAEYVKATFSNNIGIAFMDALTNEEAVQLLKKRQQKISAELSTMKAVPAHQGTMGLVIEHQVHHLQSELDWLGKVIERYGNEE